MASLLVAGDPWFAAFSPRFPAWPGPLVDGCRWVIACDSLFAASRALHADVACRLLAHPRLPLYLQYDLRAHRESQRDVPRVLLLAGEARGAPRHPDDRPRVALRGGGASRPEADERRGFRRTFHRGGVDPRRPAA